MSEEPTNIQSSGVSARESLKEKADSIFRTQQLRGFVKMDRLFAAVLLFGWAAGIVAALLISQLIVDSTGANSPYAHITLAIFAGGALALVPLSLVLLQNIALSNEGMQALATQCAKILEANEILERAAEENAKKLRNSERETRRLAALVYQSEDAILSLDLNGIVESWNRGAEKLYQFKAEEIIGWTYDPPLPPDIKQQHREMLRQVKKGRSVEAMETVTWRKDGALIPVEMTLSPIRSEDDQVIAFSVIIRDITQKKIIEKRIAEFHSVVSHELRTPLTSIRGALSLIVGGIVEQGSSQATELIDIAQKSTQRLILLINDILDLRKIEAGGFDLSLSDVNVDTLINDSVRGMRGFAEERRVHLNTTIAPNCVIRADEGRITQVLSNLISNAVKYAPENSTVEISAQRINDRMRFSVSDTGSGIPDEHQHKLFGKFQQIDSSDTRAKEGSGLGLAISKAIVEEHGGTLAFSSECNVKTTFWFEIAVVDPLTEPLNDLSNDLNKFADLTAKNQQTLKPVEETGFAFATSCGPSDDSNAQTYVRNKTLIVEGDSQLSSLLKRNLENQKYICHVAQTFEQARSYLRSNRLEAMILDLELLDGDAEELLDEMKQHDTNSGYGETPVIVIGRADLKLSTEGALADWLHKPFPNNELGEAVRRALTLNPNGKRILVLDEESEDYFIPLKAPSFTPGFISGRVSRSKSDTELKLRAGC